jgi:hypothetical protein
MLTHLIIQLHLWPRSRENPIYGSLITLGLVSAGLFRQQKTRTRRAWVFSHAQGDADFTASYNNQIGRPVGTYPGTIGGLLADGVLVPAAFVAVTEHL